MPQSIADNSKFDHSIHAKLEELGDTRESDEADEAEAEAEGEADIVPNEEEEAAEDCKTGPCYENKEAAKALVSPLEPILKIILVVNCVQRRPPMAQIATSRKVHNRTFTDAQKRRLKRV